MGYRPFFLYGMLFLSTFQRSVINANIRENEMSESAVTVSADWSERRDRVGCRRLHVVDVRSHALPYRHRWTVLINRLKAYTGCALFCVLGLGVFRSARERPIG